MRIFKFKNIAAIFILFFSISVALDAESAKTYSETVQVIQGKAETVELMGDVADILVANPLIADVGTLRTDRLYIVGRGVGETNILAYDEFGNQLANINVHVRVDDQNIQDTLRSFFPSEDIKAKTVKNNIVLTGTVSNPSVSNQVRDLASRFLTGNNQTIVDLMTVRGEQQVMLKVRMLEVQRAALKELGISTSFGVDLVNGAPTTLNRGLGYIGSNVGLTATSPFGTGAFLLGNDKHWGQVLAEFRGLETNGLINVLAEPNLTAISGETAGFLAGGEFPIPVARDRDGNITLEFKKFGVSLNFTPTVLGKDRIALNMETEVSEKDPNNSITLSSTKIDGLKVRRAETTVEMGSGNTIMIAGLIKSDTVDALNGFPGLKDIPVLGQLFQSKSFQRNESELLIMVTPYLVKPYSDAEAVMESANPSELENRLQKLMEAKVSPALAAVEESKDTSVKTTYNKPSTLSGKSRVVKVPEVEAIKMFEKTNTEVKDNDKSKNIKEKSASRKIEYVNENSKSKNILALNFIKELRSVYGKHVPSNLKQEDLMKLGYIVD